MIEQALTYIPSDDRETWVTMGMAIKSELGEGGYDIWDAWSQGADNYKVASARAVWRSIKETGGITIRTLYHAARENGWQGDGDKPVRAHDVATKLRREAEATREATRRKAAQEKAEGMVKGAELRVHPYLANKGFAHELGLVLDGLLLIPMRDQISNALNSVQTINAEGRKKFLPGGKAKGSLLLLGSPSPEIYLCEGYATALSIRAALLSHYRKAQVCVCFSAANLAFISTRFGRYVVADHDESGTGQKYAEQTGLPWWMPPRLGDANDLHLSEGLDVLANGLKDLRREGVGHGFGAPKDYASSDSGCA